MHPDCLECTQTELRNAVGLMKFLTCSTELAGRDDAECRCRHCGHSVAVPQVVFKRHQEENKLFWKRWYHARQLKALIEREATIKTELAEVTSIVGFRGGMTPQQKEMYHVRIVNELSACTGNPFDEEDTDTPTA